MTSSRLLSCVAVALLLWPALARSQMAPIGVDLPAPDPGYRIYYHGDQGPLEKVARWGYHEGWRQGRLDRDRHSESKPEAADNYKSAPEHGLNPGLSRSEYQRLYRAAFVRGYQHGQRM